VAISSETVQVIIDRAAADPDFLQNLVEDPEGTLGAAGHHISSEEADSLATALGTGDAHDAGALIETLQARVSHAGLGALSVAALGHAGASSAHAGASHINASHLSGEHASGAHADVRLAGQHADVRLAGQHADVRLAGQNADVRLAGANADGHQANALGIDPHLRGEHLGGAAASGQNADSANTAGSVEADSQLHG
jgi:hypothetical protein